MKGPASNTGPKQQNFVIMIFPTVNQRLNPGLAPIHVSENSEGATKSDWDLLLKFNISSWDEKNLWNNHLDQEAPFSAIFSTRNR